MKKMQYASLPKAGFEVSRIAFGCMSTVAIPTYRGVAEDQAVAAVHRAIDMGVTLFDTAPAYGDGASQSLLGRAIADRRDRVLIADKISRHPLTPENVHAECDQALTRLNTDHIDLYQIHWPDHDTDLAQTLGAMHELIDAGKVRAIGVCNFGPRDLAEALRHSDRIASNQVAYSLLARAAEFELAPLCRQHGLALLCYSPLSQGLLAGVFDSADQVPDGRARTRMFSGDRPQANHGEGGCEAEAFAAIDELRAVCEQLQRPMHEVALAWLLQQTGVTAALVGASRPEQVERNTPAADLTLSPEVLARLDRATGPVKVALGQSLDMWASPSRIR